MGANRAKARALWALRATVDALSSAHSSRAAERVDIGELIGRPHNCVAALGDVMAMPGTMAREMLVMRRREAFNWIWAKTGVSPKFRVRVERRGEVALFIQGRDDQAYDLVLQRKHRRSQRAKAQ